ncbi:hypothetical protein OV090_21885 [Nannocystis sp. RBIL2]|uniref:hypothetical protein n=1 Tax=Nannocystis sp. RBIL2 TaxID=2996788 RepID=UPI00226EE3C6|nr:hypothetical protein [Nannocystis sp. RBIL2]MCY1067413.1 hypothetical protein [Nannocystis sp. RBIL2]
MDPRHGIAHPFTTRSCGSFGRVAQPLVRVHLRSDASHRWSGPIEALVDTGAAITLVSNDFLVARVYATSSRLVAPILLGQHGVLDHVGLVHRNVGPNPHFRFLR